MKGLLGISLPTDSRKIVLEKIKKDILQTPHFGQVVSLNPENCVAYFEDKVFKKIVTSAQSTIIDGVGIVVAAQILGERVGERYSGVDLMADLMDWASQTSVRVALIGGKPKIAETLAHCYGRDKTEAKFIGLMGISDIFHPKSNEMNELSSIVAGHKPQIVFVSFGSPHQEKWIEANRAIFGDALCIGVGGAFDFLAGKVPRAPLLIRNLGLEWLFRLLLQPWRWKRQLKLFKFVWLVLLQRFSLLQEK